MSDIDAQSKKENTISTDWEKDIIPTVWTEKDADIVVQHIIYKELGLKGKSELE